MPELIDIGANLTHESFAPDLGAVLARAGDAGVTRMIVTGSTLAHSSAAAHLAAVHAGVLYATAGVHPHHAREFTPADLPGLRALAAAPGVVAIGECGLDYFRNYSSPAEQERAFTAQLELAVELQLPVFLHQRDAHDRFMGILRDYRDQLGHAVAHCFTAGQRELWAYLDLDLHIGITGWICDERRGSHLEPLVRDIPEDRLMLETDAPYLLPRDLRPRPKSRRNEPAYLPHILAKVATCRDTTAAALAASTTATAERFFALDAVAVRRESAAG
ncbi:MAG: TatD family hydrolase [Gammaproteobacteria bacterium]|nr:TatD family hydrolase [Gammaproteobacteria bacterium]